MKRGLVHVQWNFQFPCLGVSFCLWRTSRSTMTWRTRLSIPLSGSFFLPHIDDPDLVAWFRFNFQFPCLGVSFCLLKGLRDYDFLGRGFQFPCLGVSFCLQDHRFVELTNLSVFQFPCLGVSFCLRGTCNWGEEGVR